MKKIALEKIEKLPETTKKNNLIKKLMSKNNLIKKLMSKNNHQFMILFF